MPALHGARADRRARGPLAGLAAPPPRGGRDAADLQRGRTSPTTSCCSPAQPLHAFDLDRLAGRRVVARRAARGRAHRDPRRPGAGARPLDARDLRRRAAGRDRGHLRRRVRRGGRRDDDRVLLEAATFDGPAILEPSLRLGLRTESSSRFEKGLPRELPPRAMAIACRLLVELAGARLVPGTLDALVPAARAAAGARCGARRVPRVLGIEVPRERVGGDPDAPGLRGRRVHAEALTARVPFERAARPHPRDRPHRGGRAHPRPRRDPGRDAARRGARAPHARRRRSSTASSGSPPTSACPRRSPTTSCRSRTPTRCAWPPTTRAAQVVRLAHPMSGEMAVMRRSMLPGLLRAVARNQAHQRADGGLFEIGRTYAPRDDGLADERRFLAAVQWGRVGRRGLAQRAAPGRRPHGERPRGRADRRGPASTAEPRPNDAPLLPPGAPGAPGGRRGRPRLGRRGAPAGAARVRRRRRRSPRSCSTWTRCSPPAPTEPPGLRGPPHRPGVHARPRRRRARGRARRRPRGGGARRRRAAACAACGSSTATRASRWGRAT